MAVSKIELNGADSSVIKLLTQRFERLVFTPLGSRVMLPHFGSNIHELVDKTMNNLWKLKLKKYLFECFFDEKNRLWDKAFEPDLIRVSDVDVALGSIEIVIDFKNGLEARFGYAV